MICLYLGCSHASLMWYKHESAMTLTTWWLNMHPSLCLICMRYCRMLSWSEVQKWTGKPLNFLPRLIGKLSSANWLKGKQNAILVPCQTDVWWLMCWRLHQCTLFNLRSPLLTNCRPCMRRVKHENMPLLLHVWSTWPSFVWQSSKFIAPSLPHQRACLTWKCPTSCV